MKTFFYLVSCVSFLGTGALRSEEEKSGTHSQDLPLVTCEMKGSLGNQLFEVAATLAYAWDHGCVPIFPELNRDEFRLSYNRDNFFFRLDASDAPRPFSSFYEESFWLCSEKIPFQKDLKLSGLFQSWKHFHHHRDQLLEVFAPSRINGKLSDGKIWGPYFSS